MATNLGTPRRWGDARICLAISSADAVCYPPCVNATLPYNANKERRESREYRWCDVAAGVAQVVEHDVANVVVVGSSPITRFFDLYGKVV